MKKIGFAIPNAQKKMASLIPNSRLHVFKNADHALESDVPDLFFNAIATFISLP